MIKMILVLVVWLKLYLAGALTEGSFSIHKWHPFVRVFVALMALEMGLVLYNL